MEKKGREKPKSFLGPETMNSVLARPGSRSGTDVPVMETSMVEWGKELCDTSFCTDLPGFGQ
jgi:hypothetical protein